MKFRDFATKSTNLRKSQILELKPHPQLPCGTVMDATAENALIEFEAGQYDEAMRILETLATSKSKVALQNLAVAKYYATGCVSSTLLTDLLPLIDGDNECLEDDAPLQYNVAVSQYKVCFQLNHVGALLPYQRPHRHNCLPVLRSGSSVLRNRF